MLYSLDLKTKQFEKDSNIANTDILAETSTRKISDLYEPKDYNASPKLASRKKKKKAKKGNVEEPKIINVEST